MNALIDSLSWKKCQEKSDGAFRNMEMFHDTLCRNSSDFAITIETASNMYHRFQQRMRILKNVDLKW